MPFEMDSTISIHSPREGGDPGHGGKGRDQAISIHAPREGGDLTAEEKAEYAENFNPRPPRGGRLR